MADPVPSIYVQFASHSLRPTRLSKTREPYLLLASNNWNDYGFETTFDAWYADGDVWQHVGQVKIAVAEIKTTSSAIDLNREIERSTFAFDIKMPFISLGQSRGYYERFVSLVNPAHRASLLYQLHDAVWLETVDPANPALRLRQTDLFNVSLLREKSVVTVYGEARAILLPNEFSETRFNFEVPVNLENRPAFSLKFRFDRDNSLYSTKVSVIVGRNGLGKTQTLYAIQHLLCDPPAPPTPAPPQPAIYHPSFRHVIALSFSPFEEFHPSNQPGAVDRPRYTYCGFRQENGQWLHDHEVSITQAISLIIERQRAEGGKSRPRLALFTRALQDGFGMRKIQIKYPGAKAPVSLTEAFPDSPAVTVLPTYPLIRAQDLIFNDVPYSRLSAGQKMFVLSAANLCAAIEPTSLVLIDEPELYLHPNLECAYISMIQTVLDLFESYAIVATHSLFVVREVPERCVWVLKESGEGEVLATPPAIKTFGGDLNLIADYVFDNVASQKPFEKEWDKLANESNSFSALREKYGDRLGFDALTYLRQKMAQLQKDA